MCESQILKNKRHITGLLIIVIIQTALFISIDIRIKRLYNWINDFAHEVHETTDGKLSPPSIDIDSHLCRTYDFEKRKIEL